MVVDNTVLVGFERHPGGIRLASNAATEPETIVLYSGLADDTDRLKVAPYRLRKCRELSLGHLRRDARSSETRRYVAM